MCRLLHESRQPGCRHGAGKSGVFGISRVRGNVVAKWMIAVVVLLVNVAPADAYVGPGAGFAFVSSFFIVFFTIALAFLILLTWPIRWVFRTIMRLVRGRKSRVQRVIIVGLDGQDPELTRQFMNEGLLPNFSRLEKLGCFTKLKTTLPAESPVAWSSFQTGCNPGKHRIYDFLVPNRKSMLPELSSASVAASKRVLKLGRYRIPLGTPSMQMKRKSIPFWHILGRSGVFSTILRIPITFPPEKFHGVELSAMSVPDILGSQGTYLYFSSDPDESRTLVSGIHYPLVADGDTLSGVLPGPENTLIDDAGSLDIDFRVQRPEEGASGVEIAIDDTSYPLLPGEYSPWIHLTYKPGLRVRIYGICRFLLLESQPHVRLYVTPIQIDPERPALPVSHPSSYSIYLAKRQGPFATLGVAEDTSALNEGIIDSAAFLDQCHSVHDERETMFFDALDKTPRGNVTCVFDITDRVQHMFFRCFDDGHPASDEHDNGRYHDVFRDLYRHMDRLVGRVIDRTDENTVLIVLSDHGFKSFRYCVDINLWLEQNGFLRRVKDPSGSDMLQDIDWSGTRAYAVGFGGIYLNLRHREAHGIVEKGEEEASVKAELAGKLLALWDEATGAQPVKNVFDRYEVYEGPYVADAPDLVAGFTPGYRVAWETVTGGFGERVISPNTRAWSGDHNMNPADVPGIFFCNRKITKAFPGIVDIAPTVLDLFGAAIPSYCDGESLLPKGSP